MPNHFRAFAGGQALDERVEDCVGILHCGDFAFASPTKNPSAHGHGWHMVTASATGVSSPSLGLDQATSEVIHADCVQLEKGATRSSYIDSYQGPGFSGAVGSPSSRTSTTLSFSADGVVSPSSGTVAFWMYPLWNGTDNQEHVLFDMAVGAGQNRLRLAVAVHARWRRLYTLRAAAHPPSYGLTSGLDVKPRSALRLDFQPLLVKTVG